MVFINFKAAYDTVDRNSLLNTLRKRHENLIGITLEKIVSSVSVKARKNKLFLRIQRTVIGRTRYQRYACIGSGYSEKE